MNATNRVLNRLFLGLVGLVLLAVGAGLVAIAVVPLVRELWRVHVEAALDAVAGVAASAPIGDTGRNGLEIAAIAVLAIVAALVVTLLARLGGGRARTVLEAPSTLGAVSFSPDVARDSLVPALASSPDVASATVRVFRVRRAPALYVEVVLRRGTSPRAALDLVERRLEAFDALLGEERVALVHLGGGHRPARVTR